MPPYFIFGGWSKGIMYASKTVGLICAYYWCFPWGRAHGRAVSFALFLAHIYLSCVSASVAPWYVPNVTFLSIVVLGQIAQQVTAFVQPETNSVNNSVVMMWNKVFAVCGGGLLFASLIMTFLVGYQLKLQQEIIEHGNRKLIGLWLRENAGSPKDTVFLECLGYIGYFSNLKMYDMPGLSSGEVVAARRRLGSNNYSGVIQLLSPDWLVLRRLEAERIKRSLPFLLSKRYQLVKKYNVADRIDGYNFIPGRNYLQYDELFFVYKRI
jgi:hypothetical protein